MPLDLEHVQGQNDDFTNSDQTAGRSMHDSLSVALAECAIEAVSVVLCQVIPDERLAAILVDSLEDLVGRRIAETGEEREKAGGYRSVGLILEDDGVQLLSRSDLFKWVSSHAGTRCSRCNILCRSCSSTVSPWCRRGERP